MQEAPAAPPPHASCLNCGSGLHGPFCSQCGQEHRTGALPVREYVRDLFDDFFEFDSKLLRSLGLLLGRPGALTREFLAGRRVSYLLPSRMYLLVSIVFFFLVNRLDPVTLQSMGASGMDPGLAARVNEAVSELLPTFLLGAVPAFALGLWLVYVRSGRYFTQHLAFAFHYFTVVFVAFTLPVATHSDALWNVAFLGLLVYLFLALRTVYGQPLLKTAAKTFLLYGHFWMLLIGYFALVFLAAWVKSWT